MFLYFYSRISFIVFFIFNALFWLNYDHKLYAASEKCPPLVDFEMMGSWMSIGLFFMILMPITDIIYYLYLLKILAHTYKIPERESLTGNTFTEAVFSYSV